MLLLIIESLNQRIIKVVKHLQNHQIQLSTISTMPSNNAPIMWDVLHPHPASIPLLFLLLFPPCNSRSNVLRGTLCLGTLSCTKILTVFSLSDDLISSVTLTEVYNVHCKQCIFSLKSSSLTSSLQRTMAFQTSNSYKLGLKETHVLAQWMLLRLQRQKSRKMTSPVVNDTTK